MAVARQRARKWRSRDQLRRNEHLNQDSLPAFHGGKHSLLWMGPPVERICFTDRVYFRAGGQRAVLLRLHAHSHLRTPRHELDRQRAGRWSRAKPVRRLHAHGSTARTTGTAAPQHRHLALPRNRGRRRLIHRRRSAQVHERAHVASLVSRRAHRDAVQAARRHSASGQRTGTGLWCPH